MEIVNENDLFNFKGILVRKKGKIIGEIEGILRSNMVLVFVVNIVFLVRYQFSNCYEIINKFGYLLFFKFGDFGFGVFIIDRNGKKKVVGIVFVYWLDGIIYVCRIDKII